MTLFCIKTSAIKTSYFMISCILTQGEYSYIMTHVKQNKPLSVFAHYADAYSKCFSYLQWFSQQPAQLFSEDSFSVL